MTLTVESELRANHENFKREVISETSSVRQIVTLNNNEFFESYKLVCAFRGWHEIALQGASEEVAGFFIEAHNDILTSHVLATTGMWRSSLISLRAFMESYLAFIYFRDHPVELRQWSSGALKLEPKNLRQYCLKHPDICAYPIALASAKKLDTEYSKLSGSVHGARTDFRMTGPSSYPAISTPDLVRLRKWIKLKRDVVRTALVLMLTLNASALRGSSHPVFRKVLGSCLLPSSKLSIKQQIGVST